MSQPLTLEVSDEIYHILQHQANTVGLFITGWIMSKLSHPEINKSIDRDNNQDAEENQNWENFVLNNLNQCNSEDEPSYDLTLIKEYNHDYEKS